MKYKDLIEILQPFADEEVNVHTYKDCAIFHDKSDIIVGIDVIRKTMDINWHKDGLPQRNPQDSRFSNQCLLCMTGGWFEIGYYSFEQNAWFFPDGTGEPIGAAPKGWVELVEPKY